MRFSNIKELLDEGEEIENGYTSYLNGTVLLRKVRNNVVRNIVFTNEYTEQIFENVENNNSLEELLEEYPDNCFGSLEDGYLGYRSDLLYYFIYEDEVSVYGFSYSENTKFESALEDYLENGDLTSFANKVSAQLPTYDSYEYDEEAQNLKIVYSSYGIEINITANDPIGIILYNNYCFTSTTKQYVKNGLITFKDENLIKNMEEQRRNT